MVTQQQRILVVATLILKSSAWYEDTRDLASQVRLLQQSNEGDYARQLGSIGPIRKLMEAVGIIPENFIITQGEFASIYQELRSICTRMFPGLPAMDGTNTIYVGTRVISARILFDLDPGWVEIFHHLIDGEGRIRIFQLFAPYN